MKSESQETSDQWNEFWKPAHTCRGLSRFTGAALAACGMAAAAGVRRAARNQRRNQHANMAGNFEQMLGFRLYSPYPMILWWKKSCTTCYPNGDCYSTYYQLAEGEGCFLIPLLDGELVRTPRVCPVYSWVVYKIWNTLYTVNLMISNIDVWYVILMFTFSLTYTFVHCVLVFVFFKNIHILYIIDVYIGRARFKLKHMNI